MEKTNRIFDVVDVKTYSINGREFRIIEREHNFWISVYDLAREFGNNIRSVCKKFGGQKIFHVFTNGQENYLAFVKIASLIAIADNYQGSAFAPANQIVVGAIKSIPRHILSDSPITIESIRTENTPKANPDVNAGLPIIERPKQAIETAEKQFDANGFKFIYPDRAGNKNGLVHISVLPHKHTGCLKEGKRLSISFSRELYKQFGGYEKAKIGYHPSRRQIAIVADAAGYTVSLPKPGTNTVIVTNNVPDFLSGETFKTSISPAVVSDGVILLSLPSDNT